MREGIPTRVERVALALLGAVVVAGPAVAAELQGGRTDSFQSDMTVILTVNGLGTESVDLSGPATIVIGDRRVDNGVGVVDTEVVQLELSGQFLGNDITVRVNPDLSSVGEVRALQPNDDFPADSFFDVFVEVEITGLDRLINLEPVRVVAQNLLKLPPLFDTYTHPPPSIPLVGRSNPTGPVIATIEGESSHRPKQDPTFSIATGGTLDPGQLYALPKPPPVVLSRSGLGLQAGDDVDAVSFGTDGIDVPGQTTLAFSVDPASMGKPGSGVEQQAAASKQEGSEYVTFLQGTNQVLVSADSMVPAPTTDDLNALTDFPASDVDFNDDGVPEDPVFFSLGRGSASLGAGSPADILVSFGGSFSTFATAADLGLVSGDNVNGLCLMKANLPDTTLIPGSGAQPPMPGNVTWDFALFTLDPTSPTLAAQGHTASDVFVTDFSNNRPNLAGVQNLVLYADASEVGLLDADDMNALKCLRGAVFFEIDGRGDTDGPGNGSGCDPGDEADVAVGVDLGLRHVVADPSVAPAQTPGSFNFWEAWTIQNPYVGDRHGPYAYPGTNAAQSGAFPVLDPILDVAFIFSTGDNCLPFHVHNTYENHLDPDILACGHGVFVPWNVPISVIPGRRDVPTTVELLVAALRGNLASILPGVVVSAHRYNGPSTMTNLTDCAANETQARYLLMFSGLLVTQVNVFLELVAPFLPATAQVQGGVPAFVAPPIRIGPALRTVPPPLLVPEPGGGALAVVAIGALAALARRRARWNR